MKTSEYQQWIRKKTTQGTNTPHRIQWGTPPTERAGWSYPRKKDSPTTQHPQKNHSNPATMASVRLRR